MSRQGAYTAQLALFKNGMTVHYEVAQDAFEFLQDLKKNNSDLFDRLCEAPENAKDFIRNEVEQSIEPVEDIGVPEEWVESKLKAVVELTPLCTEERGQLSRIAREYFCLSGKYKLTDPFKKVQGEPVTGYSDIEHCWESGCRPDYTTLKSKDPLKPSIW